MNLMTLIYESLRENRSTRGGHLQPGCVLRNLRREICGDDSFKEKVESYSKSPDKAVLLTGLIVYVVNLVSLPINPAIATIVVLWVLKLGLRTFCDYTEPSSPSPLLPRGEGEPIQSPSPLGRRI